MHQILDLKIGKLILKSISGVDLKSEIQNFGRKPYKDLD